MIIHRFTPNFHLVGGIKEYLILYLSVLVVILTVLIFLCFQETAPTTRREAGGTTLAPTQIWMESGTEEDTTAAATRMASTGPSSEEERTRWRKWSWWSVRTPTPSTKTCVDARLELRDIRVACRSLLTSLQKILGRLYSEDARSLLRSCFNMLSSTDSALARSAFRESPRTLSEMKAHDTTIELRSCEIGTLQFIF